MTTWTDAELARSQAAAEARWREEQSAREGGPSNPRRVTSDDVAIIEGPDGSRVAWRLAGWVVLDADGVPLAVFGDEEDAVAFGGYDVAPATITGMRWKVTTRGTP